MDVCMFYQIWAVQQALAAVTPNFSIAAAFGNVHGVYKPGNVKLNPGILATHQASLRFCFLPPACVQRLKRVTFSLTIPLQLSPTSECYTNT